jgi:D-serine deaminase-like pyridoxal phosphate-dependent protein
MFNNITVPTLLLDEVKCRENIRQMSGKAVENKVVFRPHFKTHQSIEIGGWFREEGVDKITVSSLRMAQYFARDGWNDILVAFPVNILEIDTINELAGKISLSLLSESTETTVFLSENLKSQIDLYIKIDTGLGRTGVAFNDEKSILAILESISQSNLISFRGFLTHAGQSYNARSRDEISRVHYETISRLAALKYRFKTAFPELIISVGDTPTCSVMDDFSMVDEIRPGNFVFYDLTQTIIGSCSEGQAAVAMACPVVAVHAGRNELLIYGGSIHFSKDSVTTRDGKTVHGIVVGDNGNGWGNVIEGAYLTRLSQEHGTVQVPGEIVRSFKPGDIVKIIPAHSCTTANLMKEYLILDGRMIKMFS